MDKINEKTIKELERIVSYGNEGEHMIRNVKIVNDNKQFRIRVPKSIAEIMKIDETKDHFEFHLIPKDNEFELKAVLVKG